MLYARHYVRGFIYLHLLLQLIFTPSLERYNYRYHYHHFGDEGNEVSERLSNLPKITQLPSGGGLSDLKAGVLFLILINT